MKINSIIYLMGMLLLISSCVDDYEEANPPRLLDAPAVNSIAISDDVLKGGESTTITVNVTDAPAGLESVKVTDVDEFGVPIGGTVNVITDINGLTSGEVVVEYIAPMGFAGEATVSVVVSDGQTQRGEEANKSSVARTVEIQILCGELAGEHTIDGEILVDDFGSGPYSFTGNVTLADCSEENEYLIPDITGGLYLNSYAENYGTDGAEALIIIDSSNEVTWTGVSDQFGGQVIQDPAQPVSNYNPTSGEITIYWTATAFGERGITTITIN